MRLAGYFLFFIVIVTFMIGLVGYQANFIQLGLDQLLEAPSEYLGLFVHWAEWINNAAATVTITVLSLVFTCNIFDKSHRIKTQFVVIFMFFVYWNWYSLLHFNGYSVSFEFSQVSLVLF